MTFTEAAIEVLRREGKPLHFKKIAEIAVRESLLDHVGKIPEEVMGGQLTTHCRLPRTDRRVVAVQPGTFALVEWGLDEDPAGLENIIEPPPDIDIPYRGRERHPIPSRDLVRATARGEARARRREEGEERRSRRYPPPAEVAYEILAGADRPLSLAEIAALGAERLLMPDAFVRDSAALSAALAEDNRRREGQGRKALFAIDGETVSLAAQPEPGERAATPLAPARPAAVPADLRRTALAALRRRVRECDAPTVEHVVAQLLERMGLRELKVAKRGREHVVYTGRRRMGLADVRHCVRVLRSGGEAGRRDVTELRRDVGNYGAQIGVVVSAGDAAREARGEAGAPGQLPIVLLCGDALAEALTELGVGCRPVVVPEVDESFFKTATEAAQQEEAARRARREEREKREGGEPRERRDRGERRDERGRARDAAGGAAAPETAAAEEMPALAGGEAPEIAPAIAEREAPAEEVREGAREAAAIEPGQTPLAAAAPASASAGSEEDDEEGEAGEGEEAEEVAGPDSAAAGAAEGERPQGEGRRRRRRRRRRGGRGRGRDSQAAAPGAGGGSSEGVAAAPGAEAQAPAPSAPEPGQGAPAPEPRPDQPDTAAPEGAAGGER